MSRARRLAVAVATFASVCVLGFFVVELAPGDPAMARLGLTGGEAARHALREALGLDGAIGTRLLGWLGRIAHLDLGRSLVDGRPVRDRIFERLPATLTLAVLSLALAWCMALPLALRRARRGRRDAVDALVVVSYATPVPALALGVLAAGAPYGPGFGSILAAAVCLCPLLVPSIYAHAASGLEHALAGDELRTLRAVGASRRRVVRAALRGQALRLVTLISLQLPSLLSGVVLVEAIFGVPGLGLLAFDALASRDHPVQLGLVVFGAALSIGASLLVDWTAPLFDPRLAEPKRRRR